MRRRRFQAAALGALLLLLIATALLLRPEAPGPVRPLPAPPIGPLQIEAVPGDYVVKFQAGVSHDERDALHRAAGGRLKRRLAAIGADVVRTDGAVSAAVVAYRQSPGVAYVEPNYVVRTAVVPNDPYYASQWALPKIRAPLAWNVTTGSPSVVIAVVDTGVDATHPDLAGNVLPGWNLIADSDQTADDNGHGTHVASLAAARGDDGVGIAGVAWQSQVLPVKVLDATGTGDSATAAAGIRWAADHGARVINLSWGTLANSRTIADAIADARSRNVVLVAAAGNYGTDLPFYPAALPGVLGVAATDPSDQVAAFSNFGSDVALAAPGVGILGARPGGSYVTLSGTSMAAPHVSGAAALVLTVRPDLLPDQVGQVLERCAADFGPPGWDDHYGAGRLDVFLAVQRAANPTPLTTSAPTTSPALTPTPIAASDLITVTARLALPLVVKNAPTSCG